MRRILLPLALAALPLAAIGFASSAGPEVGSQPPELEAVKWYNSPPLTLEELRGKAVLVEVFRTW